MAWLELEVPGWPGAKPGQFALVQREASRCFLPRALSVADEQAHTVSFLIAPIGAGTRELCESRPGDRLWLLGPLGESFDLDEVGIPEPTRLLIVAGGVGSAPFPLLIRQLASRVAAADHGMTEHFEEKGLQEIIVLLGFRDARQAVAQRPVSTAVGRASQAGLRCRMEVATEDGSAGRRGKVTDLLSQELLAGDRVLVCGPTAMSLAVWHACCQVPGVRAWFSLEAGMACGVGSCHGCVITLADGSLARVCHDGPVFPGDLVFGRKGPDSSVGPE